MKKLVRLTESDLARIVKKIIKEENDFSNDYEMSGTRSRGLYTSTPKEKDVTDIFGSLHGQDVPPSVIRYMRKNPSNILKRYSQLYPEIYNKFCDCGENLEEAIEQTIKKTTYTKSDLDKAKQTGTGININNGTVSPTSDGGLVVTSESDNPFANVPKWKGRK